MMISIKKLRRLLRLPLLPRLLDGAEKSGQEMYITGGYLRDILLGGSAGKELDFTCADPDALVSRLSRAAGESFFLLDAERSTYRLNTPPGSGIIHADITRLRGPSIEEDLELRDFTANALAVKLGGDDLEVALLDPAGGASDIANRTLRVCSQRSIRDDPLRALRGIRFQAQLGLKAEPLTSSLISGASDSLRTVAAERVRDEFFQILQGPGSLEGTEMALKYGFLRPFEIFHLQGDSNTLPTLKRAVTLSESFPRSSIPGRTLSEEMEQGISRSGITRLAALLRDTCGEEGASAAAQRLKLGKRASFALRRITERPIASNWLRRPEALKGKDYLSLFHELDQALVEAALLGATSISPVSAGIDAVMNLVSRYRRKRRKFLLPSVLTGEKALEYLPLKPGPALGLLLREAREAQDLGCFRTLPGALRWARSHLGITG